MVTENAIKEATKEQLLIVALGPDNDLQIRYAVVRELQRRRWTTSMVTDFVRYYPRLLPVEIATKLGTTIQMVNEQAERLGLKQYFERREAL
ncbi:hypothetical protein P4H65_24040 [Paenibacillus chitinolyticus]|uniref:hypothetical protein n=1 Tax=Paenibacillus chitinolyticus TaxID=79263 RepID=UPI002DB6156C|nr:hypothetical protein [Paenibacillus chitinolyticus]MEC0248868.1 hypothetical protein [Paenibacillus chitinolyticus]